MEVGLTGPRLDLADRGLRTADGLSQIDQGEAVGLPIFAEGVKL